MAGPYNEVQTWTESVSAVTATNTVELGTDRKEGGFHYTYVYNAGTTQASPGHGVILSAISGYSVTVSSITSVSPCFGVVKHATFTTATYGWLLRKGFVEVEADADTGLDAADSIVMGDDGVHTRVTGATGYKASPHGYMQAATASGGSNTAWVNCL